MAPVKRGAAAAQRETRSTRAATVAKKNVIAAEKKASSPIAKKPATTTKTTGASRRTRKQVQSTEGEPEAAEETVDETAEAAKPMRSRTTKALTAKSAPTKNTTSKAALNTAPRRRIKVTPLDAVNELATNTSSRVTRNKAEVPEDTKTTTKRSRRPAKDEADVEMKDVSNNDEAVAPITTKRTKSTRMVQSRPTDETNDNPSLAPKPRGRPKKATAEEIAQVDESTSAAVPVKRATRSHRAGSTATQQSDLEVMPETQGSKPSTGVRKKVTFQDLPEDDKENQIVAPKSQKLASQKGPAKTSSLAAGLRAKPVRKAGITATTKGKKAASTISQGKGSIGKTKVSKVPHVLTPKKIKQIAKSVPLTSENSDLSEEDELNGGKTPVRDLSVSPRRPTSIAMAQRMSPVKKLVLDQNLAPVSPGKDSAVAFVGDQANLLASPARRLPASPFKDGLKDSPKRGIAESTRLLFPSQSQMQDSKSGVTGLEHNSVSENTTNALLQSPKRVGVLDPSFFSQSAIKKSSTKSPFKASLFGSPAKRLFSPAKNTTTTPVPHGLQAMEVVDGDGSNSPDLEKRTEVSASSHFRASASPIRVHRIEMETQNFDFDESVLQIGSPLRITKSPAKTHGVRQDTLDQSSAGFQQTLKSSVPTQGDWEQNGFASLKDIESSIAPSEAEHGTDSAAEGEALSVGQQQKPSSVGVVSSPNSSEDCQQVSHIREPEASFGAKTFRIEGSDGGDSSEDELALDRTPIKAFVRSRRSLAGPNSRTRESLGVAPGEASKGYGFTPLAAQMSGWLASSPQKTPKPCSVDDSSSMFSPAAGQHIEGTVVISRDSTPVQKLMRRTSQMLKSTSKKPSQGFRKSLAQRQSLGLAFAEETEMSESPARNPQFDEFMELRAMEQESHEDLGSESVPETQSSAEDFDEIMDLGSTDTHTAAEEEGDTILVSELPLDDDPTEASSPELTTDLIEFTKATDTAIVDFQELAKEANELATVANDEQSDRLQSPEAEEPASASGEQTLGELSLPSEEPGHALLSSPGQGLVEQFPLPEKALSPMIRPTDVGLESPSIMIMDPAASTSVSPQQENMGDLSLAPVPAEVTPIRPQVSLGPRMINTVVSKVPLKPEGHVSPIKVHKKRARSFGNNDSSPRKRVSLGNLKPLPVLQNEEVVVSPDRRLRTSAAPSPGGTSTPASQYSRKSRGTFSVATTPGQLSFAVDDFGDSTLDGIELPDEFEHDTLAFDASEPATPAMSEKTFGLSNMLATPCAASQATPATVKASARRASTPANTKKTPATVKKTPQRHSTSETPHRTPLQAVGSGVLDGAVVFVDVHTSEGADASGIFVDLLAQMGARCVKEWRWNHRASLAPAATGEQPESNIGITHVVYKDGGKRTLEKVRQAKGEVLCVGVAWVLDCERQSKWLDETNYAVDTSLMPRGGSKRRKSMEPRALLISGDGSVSTSKARRSVSAEMSEAMKKELVNTPARGQGLLRQANHDEDDNEDDDDLDDFEYQQTSTPTGYISYDPRTAMTPGTPGLFNPNKQIIQKSAPPKQTGKRLFDDDDDNDENDDTFMEHEAKGLDTSKSVTDAKKFRMKNLDMKSRRRTLGFKPVVGSPLGRC